MPTKKPATNEQTAIDTTGMNVWSKLLAVRNEFTPQERRKQEEIFMPNLCISS